MIPTSRTLSPILKLVIGFPAKASGTMRSTRCMVLAVSVHSMASSEGSIQRFTCWVVHSDVATVGMPNFM